MTWSSLASVVTPAPTSTTTPAPSWPRIAGNRPSGSSPDKVNQSVWQMPVALTSTSTSPARGPSRSTVSMVRGWPAFQAMAALVFMLVLAHPVLHDLPAMTTPSNIHTAAQQGYPKAAASYQRGRPEYPRQLLAWLTDTLGL